MIRRVIALLTRSDERPISQRDLVRIALIETALLVLLAVTLIALGRVLTCTCGTVALWAGDIYSAENSQQLADPYTVTHVTHGMLFYGATRLLWPRSPLPARLTLAIIVEVAWEALENSPLIIDRYRETTVALGYYGDSVLNSVGDVLFCILGFALASRITGRANILAVVMTELVLLLWIRDNLTLNVLMLLYPVPAIRAWQLAAAP